jgi:hypothetical protein
LRATILDPPQEGADDYGSNSYRTLIGDETGVVILEETGDRFLSKLDSGDTVRIIGAWANAERLRLGHYGVIEKTGNASFTSVQNLNRGVQIFPPDRGHRTSQGSTESWCKSNFT